MILDSLRHWVHHGHVDGFRFDLASVFTRRSDGSVFWNDSPVVSAIRADPALGNVRLIAEPWDARGLYQLGASFPGKRWLQWNGRFRDDMRRFVRGDPGLIPAVMCRLYGSDDLFPDDLMNAYHPYQSVNYVTSHDGFTLYDQVSYNERNNWANGEENRDGHKDNNSWNCGWEGDRDVPADVLVLRKRQVKNFFTLLMLANGTPMFCAGDEFLNTQFGNNNPYNQDNDTTWLDWGRLESNQDIFRFFSLMVAFRKSHPSIARSRFWRADVRWYGMQKHIDMSHESRHLAFYLDGEAEGDADLYVMINAHPEARAFHVQEAGHSPWTIAVDTYRDGPDDIRPVGAERPMQGLSHEVGGRSVVVLTRER
jgi:glycogen operon protein